METFVSSKLLSGGLADSRTQQRLGCATARIAEG